MRIWRKELRVGWGVTFQVWEVALVLCGSVLAGVSALVGGLFESVLDAVAGTACLLLLLSTVARAAYAKVSRSPRQP